MNEMPLIGEYTEHFGNLLGSTVNRTRKTTSLALKMKLHVHVEEVAKRLARNLADCALRNCGEDGIAHLAKGSRAHTSQTVCPC